MKASGPVLAISRRSPRLAWGWVGLSGRRSFASQHPDASPPPFPPNGNNFTGFRMEECAIFVVLVDSPYFSHTLSDPNM